MPNPVSKAAKNDSADVYLIMSSMARKCSYLLNTKHKGNTLSNEEK